MSITKPWVEPRPTSSRNGVEDKTGTGGVFTEPELALPLRELSRDEAVAEVLAFLRTNGRTDSFDIAMALNLDPEYVETLCADLATNGHLTVK